MGVVSSALSVPLRLCHAIVGRAFEPGLACSGSKKAGNAVSLETRTYDFMAKALRDIKLISNQLPRAACAFDDNEGQVRGKAYSAI
jgi:hypothetical protein